MSFAGLLQQIALWTLVALFTPLRRVRGWRLTRSDTASPAERGQFRIGDLLIWMAIIAVPLALIRVFISDGTGEGSVAPGVRAFGLSALVLFPMLGIAFLVSFAPRGWRPSWLYTAGVVAYLAIAATMVTHEFYHLCYELWWPRPGWMLLLYGIAFSVAFLVVPSLVVWLNCQALRKLGYRLIRPAWQPSAAIGESPVAAAVDTAA